MRIIITNKEKKRKREKNNNSINNKNQKRNGKNSRRNQNRSLCGIAAYVAEVVVAGSVVIELVSKWNERRKLKSAVRVKAAAEEVAETD